MAYSRYREGERRYADEDYYRSGYYDRDYDRDYHRGYDRGYAGDYARDYTRPYQEDWEEMRHMHRETKVGLGAGAAVMALAAFGLGWWMGARWHPESYERVGGMPRRDLRPEPTLDNYHGHVSVNDPDAPAGTPPDADQITGQARSNKSASESAETLRRSGQESTQPRSTVATSSSTTTGTR